jgi:hypothetical protein
MTLGGAAMRWLRTYAVTIYGVAILAVILGGRTLGPQYDDGGLGFFYHFVLVPVFGFMFYLPQEMLQSIGGGTPVPGEFFLSIVLGLSFCLGVDYLRYRMGRNKAQHDFAN